MCIYYTRDKVLKPFVKATMKVESEREKWKKNLYMTEIAIWPPHYRISSAYTVIYQLSSNSVYLIVLLPR